MTTLVDMTLVVVGSGVVVGGSVVAIVVQVDVVVGGIRGVVVSGAS